MKCAPTEGDDVEEDDVKMSGEGGDSGEGSRVDEDPFEKQILLTNDVIEEQVRTSTTQRYVKPQTLDQLEKWIKVKPIPHISNNKFSQEFIFHLLG